MRFDWDPNKADRNLAKHGIRFEQALTAFDDPFGRAEDDQTHSTPNEKREHRIGESDVGVLMIVFTIRLPGPVYRIISARRANHHERSLYEENKRIQLR